MAITRRGLLRSTVVASTALAMGWESVLGEAKLVCDQALSGGKLIRTLRFEDEKRTRYHQRSQQGWDGRLYAEAGGRALPPRRGPLAAWEQRVETTS